MLFNQHSQCIDSKIVEKLDIIEGQKSDSTYNCRSRKKSNYSDKIEIVKDQITRRLELTYLMLESMRPFKNKIQIVIDDDHPLTFDIRYNKLKIGRGLLASNGHLERGLIKIWISENAPDSKVKFNLFYDVFSDLIYYITFGKIDYFDPVNRTLTKTGSVKWPQVLKNLEVYCDSAWKNSEDFEECGQLSSQIGDEDRAGSHVLMTASLRPLLTSSLIYAYNEMTAAERSRFVSYLPHILSLQQLTSDKAIQVILDKENPLQEGLKAIRLFADHLSKEELSQFNEVRQFNSLMTMYLQNQGVNDSFAEAYFDYLIEYPDQLSEKSVFFKSLEAASKQNLNLQIAVKDSTRVWILPSRSGLPDSVFDQIHVRQHVYFACPILKEIQVQNFIKSSEKFLLIRGCDSNSDFHFSSLLAFGVKEFVQQNKDIAFIQFHLPSLEMKLKEFSPTVNYFDLVKHRDLKQDEFQKLGWVDIQWIEKGHYYRPKAAIDAIEFFRVDAPLKNE